MQMYTRGLGSKSVTVYGYSTEPHSLYGHFTLYIVQLVDQYAIYTCTYTHNIHCLCGFCCLPLAAVYTMAPVLNNI